MRRRRADVGHILAAAAIIAGGLGIGLLEALRFPRSSVWMVGAITFGLMVIARSLSSRR
jgi:hypothetical protein